MAAASRSGGPDMAYIAELYENISREPPAIGARKLLIEHYISVGNEWLDGALDEAKQLKILAPADPEVTSFLQQLEKKSEPPAPEKKATPVASASRLWEYKANTARHKSTTWSMPDSKRTDATSVQPIGDLDEARQDLTTGYRNMRAKATSVLGHLLRLQSLHRKAGLPQSENVDKVKAIADGRRAGTSSKIRSPGSARAVARHVRDHPKEATEFVIADLEDSMDWIRAPCGKPSGASIDETRDYLVKRKSAIESALPEELKVHCELAFMHVEHERLNRNYVNDETMLGDEVKDIPRADFYVTEDNYAWSMDELVQAIQANSGVLRNPLSKEMFTPKDIKGILMHPSGHPLAALRVEQREMSKGVRTETIDRMEKLSKVFLDDDSSDTIPSRTAVDEFLVYIATCEYTDACTTRLIKRS
jgi:hypothetical protein